MTLSESTIKTEIKSFATSEEFRPVRVEEGRGGARVVEGEKIRWVRGRQLGRGSEGSVFRALEAGTGRLLAVKQIDIEVDSSRDTCWEKELAHLEQLSHPNVVRYLAHENVGNSLLVYMEGACSGNLDELARRFGPLE